jgi:hypothetical protein
MRVRLGSASYLTAAGAGYGIGLDEDGHRIEFVGDWRALEALGAELRHDSVYVDVEGWQIVAVDDEATRVRVGGSIRMRALAISCAAAFELVPHTGFANGGRWRVL